MPMHPSPMVGDTPRRAQGNLHSHPFIPHPSLTHPRTTAQLAYEMIGSGNTRSSPHETDLSSAIGGMGYASVCPQAMPFLLPAPLGHPQSHRRLPLAPHRPTTTSRQLPRLLGPSTSKIIQPI